MRLLDYAEQTLKVGTDQPFAALEAVHAKGRDVLLMGSWPGDAGGAALSRRLARAVEAHGWSSLFNDLFLATGTKAPFSLDSNAVVPQKQRVDEQRSYAWWFVGGIAVLLVVLLVRWVMARRRRRQIAEIVEAKIAAHDTSGGGGGDGTGA